MAKKQLEITARALRDIEGIETYYLETASEAVANRVVDAVLAEAEKLAELDLTYRPGIREGTRECVMKKFPYTLIYVTTPRRVKIARVLHQRVEYFNRQKSAKK